MASILVVEDEPILSRNIRDALEFAGHDAICAATGEQAIEAVARHRPDIVLLDYRLPGMNGLEVLLQLRKAGSTTAVIMATAHGNIDIAVEAMKAGASDFLTKPLELKELELVIDRVLKQQAVAAELDYFRRRERTASSGDQIIGDSKPMRQVKAFIERITSTPALSSKHPPSILITGETGTGKDLAARAIHYAGPRCDAQFVHVSCTAIPDHLAESELFGHVKGAFTDARSDKRGLFEVADHGTLFLDEIGHMPIMLQAKLLGVIERRTIRPVGATRERTIDVHVVAATNRDLQKAIEIGEFREDLYHRLRVLTLPMPPLRDRGEDRIQLANRFLRMHADRFNVRVERFDDEAIDAINAYKWPGNVRELLHAVESAVLVADGPIIGAEHLGIKVPSQTERLDIELAGGHKSIKLDFGGDCPKLEEVEHEIILAALEFSKHNLSRAARILGISRDAIRYRLEKFGKQDGNT